MRFPFVTRAHHEETVLQLKAQLTALAKLLYPHGVPEEFQLLLGIHIEAKPGEQPERQLTEDEKAIAEMKAEQDRDRAELARIKRTRPSQLGNAMSRYMAKWGHHRAIQASKPAPLSPAGEMFAKAEAEALESIPQAQA